MTQKEFVDTIKELLIEQGTDVILDEISDPFGQPPSQNLLARKEWFDKLDDFGKEMVTDIIKTSLDMTVYRIFTLLDHNWFIENGPNKGRLNLFYENTKTDQMLFLNDPNEEELHTLL